MNETNLFSSLVGGLGTNILVTFLAMILPLGVGIGLTVLMHLTHKSPLPKIFRYIAIITEGIAPCVLIFILFFSMPQMLMDFFSSFRTTPLPCAVVTLSVCFMGYMVFRYDERYSLVKNITVNSIGLMADMLKWCFSITSVVGISDIMGAARTHASTTFDYSAFFGVFILTFVILAFLYVIRQICKDFMK